MFFLSEIQHNHLLVTVLVTVTVHDIAPYNVITVPNASVSKSWVIHFHTDAANTSIHLHHLTAYKTLINMVPGTFWNSKQYVSLIYFAFGIPLKKMLWYNGWIVLIQCNEALPLPTNINICTSKYT